MTSYVRNDPSVDAYLHEGISCQLSSRSDLKLLFGIRRPNKKNKKNKVSSDIGPVGYLIQQCKRSSDRLKFSMNVWLFDCSTYPVYSRCDLLAWFEIQELSPSGE